MLVLSRRRSEQIHIGDDITITVVRIQDGNVRLGIDAPKHIRITRPDAINKHEPTNSVRPLSNLRPSKDRQDKTDSHMSEPGDMLNG